MTHWTGYLRNYNCSKFSYKTLTKVKETNLLGIINFNLRKSTHIKEPMYLRGKRLMFLQTSKKSIYIIYALIRK